MVSNQNSFPTLTLMGSPGCGKGTQSKLLEERLNFQHISTGDLCRQSIERNDPHAAQLRSLMDVGKLVPDELIIELLNE